MDASACYFENHACTYFPCHMGADAQNFNCLLCFCPLYPLGAHCGGDFVRLPDGQKDCSACLYPHKAENYSAICAKLAALCKQFAPDEAT